MAVLQKSMKIAESVNKSLERLMPVVTPGAMLTGFLMPGIFILVRPWVTLLFAIVTFSGALRLRTGEFSQTIRRPLPILIAFVFTHILMPLIALSVSLLFFRNDADTAAGYVLLYSSPTAVSGFIWVSIFRGDPALSLTLILLDTLLAPLIVPGTLSVLLGTKVAINMAGMAVSLVLMVVAPTIAGSAVNEISRGRIPALVCPYLTPLSKICIILVIAANTAPVASKVRFSDPKVWGIGALCVLLAAISYGFSKLSGIIGRLNPEKRITLFFAGGLRNISAATTIAVEYFPEAAALPTLMGIMFQQSMAAIMGKLLMEKAAEEDTPA